MSVVDTCPQGRSWDWVGGTDPWADYECLALPPDVTACANPAELGAEYVERAR